jgi:hypothetical protein
VPGHDQGDLPVVADEVLVGGGQLAQRLRVGVLDLVDGDEHTRAAQEAQQLAEPGVEGGR